MIILKVKKTDMRIEHIAIYLQDLEKGREFFEKYFNAKSNSLYHNRIKQFKSYFLVFENGARLELMHLPDLKGESLYTNKLGYAHIAFSVGSKEKVLSLTERLRADGFCITSEPRTTGDGYFESSVSFEGNIIEITV